MASGSPRVLVIDEFVDMAMMVQDYLRLLGYVAQAASGQRAVASALEELLPDVVLLEPRTRDGSGAHLATELREWARARHRRLWIVAYSTMPADRVSVDATMYDDYVDKVKVPTQLPRCLARLLRER